jgi:hypothetical protein
MISTIIEKRSINKFPKPEMPHRHFLWGLYGTVWICVPVFLFFLPCLVAMILNAEGCGRPRYRWFLLSLEDLSIKNFNRPLAV